ncbi:replication initiation protein [bacterium]|nr:replication initiation protein [bacterium]
MNFLLLPFFALSWREVKKRTRIEYKARLKRGGEEVNLSWVVSANVDYGIPTPFDKEIKGVVDAIIEKTEKPILNPLELPYIAEMARMIDLKPNKNGKYPGWVYRKIKDSFRRMTLTGVESRGTFYIKGKSIWADKTFHLYDSVIFRGEKLPDGTIAENNYLWLNDLFLDSINDNYMKPINYTYFQSLKNCISKRLYEFLGIKFYGLRNKREKFFRIGYLNLCQLLPITPQKSFSLINKNLKPAHDELIQKGFLSKVEYERTKDGKSFNILYFPGERARKEMQGDWGIEILEEEIRPLEIEAPGEKAIKEESLKADRSALSSNPNQPPSELRVTNEKPQPDYEEELSPISQELINRGMTKSVALDFAEHLPEDYIQEKIEMHDYKKEIGEITTNSAGWLRAAISQDYKLSEGQLKKQAQLEKKQAQQEEQGILEEKAKEIQEQRLLAALQTFPDSEQWVREHVVEHVKVREMTIESIGGEQFTEEEIKEMYLRYKAQIPKTDEEKRAWLISNYNEYALSTIIEELREEQQKHQQEESKETADEPVLLNSIEDVLAEVARQRAEFEENN